MTASFFKKKWFVFSLPLLLLCLAIFELIYFLTLKPFSYPQDLEISFYPDKIERIIEAMTLEEKIGTLFLVGFNGGVLDHKTQDFLKEHHFRHFLLLGKNINDQKQLKELTTSLQQVNPGINLSLMAVDQEGGQVSRIRFANVDLTSQAKITASSKAYKLAKERGEMLKDLGINVNFAPVVEVVRYKNSFLNQQQRAFLGDEEKVFELSQAMIRGYQDQAIIPVSKHFPGGLGRKPADPHKLLPVLEINKEEVEKDLIPFKKLIKSNRSPAMMTTHILYPQIDPDLPVSLSEAFIRSILRHDLGFRGVVISDDLAMKAITNKHSVAQAAKLAFKAGTDLLVISGGEEEQTQAYQLMLQAVQTGEISPKRVEASLRRILLLVQ